MASALSSVVALICLVDIQLTTVSVLPEHEYDQHYSDGFASSSSDDNVCQELRPGLCLYMVSVLHRNLGLEWTLIA